MRSVPSLVITSNFCRALARRFLRARAVLEIPERLEKHDFKPEIADQVPGFQWAVLEPDEILLKDFYAIKPGGRDRGKLLTKVPGNRNCGNRGFHLTKDGGCFGRPLIIIYVKKYQIFLANGLKPVATPATASRWSRAANMLQSLSDVCFEHVCRSVGITRQRSIENGSVLIDSLLTTVCQDQHLVPQILVEENRV